MSLGYWNIIRLVIYFATWVSFANGVDIELTVSVDPGTQTCLYQAVKKGESVHVHYHVVSGGQGDFDINFQLYSPSGQTILSEAKTLMSSHNYLVVETGDHKFCWDNYFSHFNSKTVAFSIYVENEDEDWEDSFQLDPDDDYEGLINSIKEVLFKVHSMLSRVKHIQEVFRVNEARDRNVAERNYDCVNNSSMTLLGIMIMVGLVQIAAIRALLDIHSIFRKILCKLGFKNYI